MLAEKPLTKEIADQLADAILADAPRFRDSALAGVIKALENWQTQCAMCNVAAGLSPLCTDPYRDLGGMYRRGR